MDSTTYTNSIQRLEAERAKFRLSHLATNTIVGYGYDWRMFSAWCARMGQVDLPTTSEIVSLYLTDLLDQGKKVSTATRRKSAIVHMHRKSGYPSPATEDVLSLLHGAQRLRCEQPRQMRAFTLEDIRAIGKHLTQEGSPRAIRNRAIVVVGFASSLRRSTLAELTVDDLEFTSHGVILRIRREKQDQEGRGRFIGLPRGRHPETCPVRCLRAWLKVRGGQTTGTLFTHIGSIRPLKGDAIHHMVKACAARIGLESRNYGAHSLRAGFVTTAAEAGASDLMIADHTGHRTLHTLKRYFRRVRIWKSNVAGMIGL